MAAVVESPVSKDASKYLDSVIDSVVVDLDATISDSYGGTGQTWANLINSPADGAGQTDYDFYLGADENASTDDPTFTGDAGAAAAYFALDGGDFVRLAGSNTTFIENWHKDNGNGGAAFAFFITFQFAEGVQSVMATKQSGASRGVNIWIDSNHKVKFTQHNGTSSTTATSTAALTNGAQYVVGVAVDQAANAVRMWLGSGTAEDTSLTYGEVADAAAGKLTAAALPGGTLLPMKNGTRIYNISAFNEFIDNTKAAAIIEHLEKRHSRDYTP